MPAPTYNNSTVESLHISQGVGDVTTPHTIEVISGRVYCQEHDCGRGFSSKTHLESHVKFFHSGRPEFVEAREGVPSSSKDVVERSAERPPEYHTSTSTVTPPHVGERMTQENRDPHPSARVLVPTLSAGGRQNIDSVVESAGTRSRIPTGPSASTLAGINTQPRMALPTTGVLSLDCRVCEAPPMITTKPTVTTCGHLFCSECITKHVVSTSRCPVCNSSLLLYCLFALDLQVAS